MTSDEEVTFTVAGVPIPQGSMRSLGKGRPMVHANPDLDKWRTAVGWGARAALPKKWSKAGAFALSATFYFTRPAYLPKTVLLPIVHKNDIDKLVRGVMDAMKGIVYDDDGQVTDLVHIRKRFGNPSAHIDINRVIG